MQYHAPVSTRQRRQLRKGLCCDLASPGPCACASFETPRLHAQVHWFIVVLDCKGVLNARWGSCGGITCKVCVPDGVIQRKKSYLLTCWQFPSVRSAPRAQRSVPIPSSPFVPVKAWKSILKRVGINQVRSYRVGSVCAGAKHLAPCGTFCPRNCACACACADLSGGEQAPRSY